MVFANYRRLRVCPALPISQLKRNEGKADEMRDISWSEGTWTNEPAEVSHRGNDLLVTAVEGSDAWRLTSYGFIHDNEHGLLVEFPQDSAMEVEFTAAFSQQFDQAGIFIRVSAEHWIKAGVEFADGRPQVGAVVTNGYSDWSLCPVPEWVDQRILIRVSRSGDTLTIRARAGEGSLQLVRVVPLAPELYVEAGPLVCAPTRAGLVVPIHSWRLAEPDSSLH